MIAQDNIEGQEKDKLSSDNAAKSYISIMNENWQDNIDFVLLPEKPSYNPYYRLFFQ